MKTKIKTPIWTFNGQSVLDESGLNVCTKANGPLISAAPDLLAVAQAAAEWAKDAPSPYRDWPFVIAAREALRKAGQA